jgi:hypothetical protein
LIPLIEKLLGDVGRYRCVGFGYVALWPVFMGAVEVYKVEPKRWVRARMDGDAMMGARNRGVVREVVEGMWRRRGEMSGGGGGEQCVKGILKLLKLLKHILIEY